MKNKLRQVIGFGFLTSFAIAGRYVFVAKGLQLFPNFEVVTVAAFIGIMLLDVRIAMLIPLISMVCSDMLLGNLIFSGEKMNQIVMFTYSGFALLVLAGIFVEKKIKPYISSITSRAIFCMTVTGVLLVFMYDIWTNFGWWYLMYPHTGEALITVYMLGIPFMVYHLISGITTFICIGLPVILYVSRQQPELSTKKLRSMVWKQKAPAGVIALILVIISLTGCLSASVQQDKSGEIVENVSMRISAPEWNITYMNVTTNNRTVANFLFECAEHYNFSVKASYWKGYDSLFVEALHDVENGKNGKYWQYYVNGEYAQVGCSMYHLYDNDVVEWRFESSR